jgi:hypothetical protein
MNALYRLSAGAALAVALLAPTQAFAWKHWSADEDGGGVLGVWDRSDMPLDYCIGPLPTDASIEPEDFRTGILWGFDQWVTGAPCAQLSSNPDPGECAKNDWPNANDHQNSLTFMHEDEGGGTHFDPGVLAFTIDSPGTRGQFMFNRDGRRYTRTTDSDIVFNMDIDWTTPEAVAAGTCANQTVFEAVSTHEIGHLWGMGHACDKNDLCLDSDYLDATMYWSAGPCDIKSIDINSDDIEGITALYGPYATFECNRELDPDDPQTLAFGIVPFDLQCKVESNNIGELNEVTWNWGDGESSTGLDVTHTYTKAGNFTMNVEFLGTSDECGAWTYREARDGYVRSCDVPAPEFTFDHKDGLTYDLLNNTNLSVYGCIFDVQWDIFSEDGTLVDSLKAWEPTYTFPSSGDYRVVLNVGGPAGTGAAELTLSAKNTRGDNYGTCSTSPAAGASMALLGVLLVVSRRKRA